MTQNINIYIWEPGERDVGHASLEIDIEDGKKEYLSFWPAGRAYGSLANPREARFHSSYEEDVVAEGKEASYFYQISPTPEQAAILLEEIEKIKNMRSQYLIANAPEENCYNCSGIVEQALTTAFSIHFGDPTASMPTRTASVIEETINNPDPVVSIRKKDIMTRDVTARL